jgi:hypothetical protein
MKFGLAAAMRWIFFMEREITRLEIARLLRAGTVT